jgi:hypothetical protein
MQTREHTYAALKLPMSDGTDTILNPEFGAL